MRSAARHGPDPKPFGDGLIAATALAHSLVVVTRNLADFEATGVPLLNPWQQGQGSGTPMAANACARRPPFFCCARGPEGDRWRPCGRVLTRVDSLRQVRVLRMGFVFFQNYDYH